jgi:hypothetical protein
MLMLLLMLMMKIGSSCVCSLVIFALQSVGLRQKAAATMAC